MKKKIIANIKAFFRLLPKAILFAVPMGLIFVYWVDFDSQNLYLEGYIIGFVLGLVGFYLIRLFSTLVYKNLTKIEEKIKVKAKPPKLKM